MGYKHSMWTPTSKTVRPWDTRASGWQGKKEPRGGSSSEQAPSRNSFRQQGGSLDTDWWLASGPRTGEKGYSGRFAPMAQALVCKSYFRILYDFQIPGFQAAGSLGVSLFCPPPNHPPVLSICVICTNTRCEHLANSTKKDLVTQHGSWGCPPATPRTQPEPRPERQAVMVVMVAGELLVISHTQSRCWRDT